VEGDCGHFAYAHADRWQNPRRANSDAKSLVERAVVRHSARTYYLGRAGPTGGLLDIEFDFIAHELVCRSSSGQIKRLTLRPQSVAAFFAEYLAALADLGVKVDIDPMPVELKQPIRFHQDTTHKSYEADAVLRFWQVLLSLT
jgi:hypothetical protein